MTDWRDARLDKALAHAPDADDAPAEATRAAIRQRAMQAVLQQAAPATAAAPASRKPQALPWWRRWFAPSTGGPRMPWNAAFASLLLAGVITLVWRDHEIPGARGDDPVITSQPAPAPASPGPDAAPAAAPSTAASVPANPPRAQSQQKRATEPASPPLASAAPTPAAPAVRNRAPIAGDSSAAPPVPVESVQPVAPAPSRAPESTPAPAPAPAQPPSANAPQADQAATTPDRARSERAAELESGRAKEASKAAAPPSQSQASPPAAPPGFAAAPAAPSAAAAAPAAPAAAAPSIGGALSGRADASIQGATAQALASWTEARILLQDRTVLLPRTQAGALAAAIRAMALAATDQQGLGEAVAVRIELKRDAQDLGVLELADTGVRWTLLRLGAVSVLTGRPDAAQLRALRLALERLN